MKKTTVKSKLVLRSQTIKALVKRDLAPVRGGDTPVTTPCPRADFKELK